MADILKDLNRICGDSKIIKFDWLFNPDTANDVFSFSKDFNP